MITPRTSMRTFRIEDNPDPVQSSSYYSRHFEYFDLQPEGKTIRQLVLDFRERVGEIFIRHCHLEPETYDFNEFRLSRTYRTQRELQNYLLQLSSWLYRGKRFPPSLKKALGKWSRFKNPYHTCTFASPSPAYLATLRELDLTVLYNLNFSPEDYYLRALITEEFENRGIDTSCLTQYPKPQKIEIRKLNTSWYLHVLTEADAHEFL